MARWARRLLRLILGLERGLIKKQTLRGNMGPFSVRRGEKLETHIFKTRSQNMGIY